jgi:hypothetical protein
VFKDYRVHKVYRESRDLLDYKVQQVYKVSQEHPAVQQDGRDPRVYRGFQEVPPIQAQQDLRGSQDGQAPQDKQVFKVLLDLRVQQELLDLPPIQAQQEPQESQVPRVQQVPEAEVEVQCRLLDRLGLRVS